MEIKNQGNVLLHFSAKWCGPCKAMSPVVKILGEKYKDLIEIQKVDVDEDKELPAKYDVRSIPTFILLKGGKEFAKTKGAMTSIQFESFIKKVIDG